MVSLTVHQARLVFAPPQGAYDLHRDLCRAFGGPRCGAYLFRSDVDRGEQAARRVVLVQSTGPGNWSLLADRVTSSEAHERTFELAEGARFRFFLRANVTQAKKASLHELAEVRGEAFRKLRGKRVAVWGESELIAWLRRQGARWGFRLMETDFKQDDTSSTAVPAVRVALGRDVEWRGNGQRGKHAGADFEGLLIVEDPERLSDAVRSGIGPAKAFGFGLLSLGRVL
jgi:CRISPR system Cascade subunit CasE